MIRVHLISGSLLFFSFSCGKRRHKCRAKNHIKVALINDKGGIRIRNAQGIEAEFGRKADKLERIARFLRSKNAPDLRCLL
jgi:hypothetical protein